MEIKENKNGQTETGKDDVEMKIAPEQSEVSLSDDAMDQISGGFGAAVETPAKISRVKCGTPIITPWI